MFKKTDPLYVFDNFMTNGHVLIPRDKTPNWVRDTIPGKYQKKTGVRFAEADPADLKKYFAKSSKANDPIDISSWEEIKDGNITVHIFTTQSGNKIGISDRYVKALKFGNPRVRLGSTKDPIYIFDENNIPIALIMPYLYNGVVPTCETKQPERGGIILTEDQFHEYNEMLLGICITCHETTENCEPDAERYRCLNCETNTVYGTEQLLLMGLVSIEEYA